MWLAVFFIFNGSTFWHVFCCQLKCWICWQKLTGFLSIHSGHKQWKVQFIAMWLPFQTVLLTAYKQQACFVLRRYDSLCRMCHKSFRTYIAFVWNICHTELLHVFSKRSSMCLHLYKCVGAISNICCNCSEYEKCILLWTVWICSTHSI
jgi:hypothetical protein